MNNSKYRGELACPSIDANVLTCLDNTLEASDQLFLLNGPDVSRDSH
jgi:hypothetical protein